MINSKKKGNRNERLCASVMSDWTGIKFTKVPASGGMRLKDTSLMAGDLMPEEGTSMDKEADNYMPFIIETKHKAKLHYETPLPDRSLLRNIWNKAIEDANRSGRIPIALLRENGMPKGEYLFIVSGIHFYTPLFTQSVKPLFVSDITKDYFVGYNSKTFFESITYKQFCNAIK